MKNIEENYNAEISKLRQQVASKRDETSSLTNDIMNENKRLDEELRRLRR